MPAQLSTTLANFTADDPGSWRFLLDRAGAADRAGIDRLVVSDHVVYGEALDAYSRPELGGTVGGTQPTGPDGHWLEPVTLLAAVSSVTTRVRLGTSILLAALRRPITLAKSLATLDVLSDGRVDLGVGVGWQREEYQAAGLEFDGRGALLDHTLSVITTVWREKVADFGDERLRFERIHSMPKPRQAAGLPIWVSGRVNPMVARRIVRFGSGWIPWGEAAADLPRGLAQMTELVEAAGGSMSGLQVVGNVAVVRHADRRVDLAATMDAAAALVAAGATDVRAPISVPDDPNGAYETYAAHVEAFRAVTA